MMLPLGKAIRLGSALAVLGLLAWTPMPARASITPTLVTETNNGNGLFTFSYSADISSDQSVSNGDFLTVYDFHGQVPNSIHVTSGWSFTVQNVGITPTSTLPTDDPTVANITFTNTGGTVSGPSSFTFSAQSTAGGQGTSFFAASTTLNSGPLAGTKTANLGLYISPSGVGGQQVETPEPASGLLLALGLPVGLALLLRGGRRSLV
jgi:hypothetical protein